MSGISAPLGTDSVCRPISSPVAGERNQQERITGPPPGYTWLLWGGQKVYFNGEPVYVLKEST